MSKRELGLLLLLCALLSALITLGAVAYLKRQIPAPLAVVDLQGLIEAQQRDVLALVGEGKTATPEQRMQIDARAAAFARRLSQAVDALGNQCQCAIVNKAALLGGSVQDFSDELRTLMKEP